VSREVVLKKVAAKYCAQIPGLGVTEWADDAETAYLNACVAADKIQRVSVPTWVKIATAGLIIALIALTAARSIERSVNSLRSNLFDPNPDKVEKSRENFRLFLEKYKPLIEEWQRATEKK
jgi:hypothetical protein